MKHPSVVRTDTGSSNQQFSSKKYLFDNPRNIKILLGCFYVSLFILLIIEFFISKHPHYPWEAWPEFYAVYGFVACVVLVVAAKYILRPLVKRREDYYD
ncbi:MAG: hypothetical protein B5M55_03185 [Desulfococcus sp. 4484_242]|nr:MAG: hypothetical protein B5M55_03185 [Desulfococcus sp. 4484_242]